MIKEYHNLIGFSPPEHFDDRTGQSISIAFEDVEREMILQNLESDLKILHLIERALNYFETTNKKIFYRDYEQGVVVKVNPIPLLYSLRSNYEEEEELEPEMIS